MNNKWNQSSNFLEVGRKPDISAQSLGMSTLLRNVFEKRVSGHDATLYDSSESGNIKDKASADQVYDYLVKQGGKLIYKYHNDKFYSKIFLWDESIVELECSGENYMSVTAHSMNEEFITELRGFIKPLFTKEISQGHVFAIVSRGGGLALNSLGNAGITLERRNYSPEVIEGYDYVVKDLNADAPSGRIVIMEGEPGTGKTHLVRGMLMDVPDAMFVLVSPDMVSVLGGPELLPLLFSHRDNQSGPIILILEDADKCLVTRQGDNINSIQSLLNLGDGILGSLLDLRIIATTNAKKLEMEQAILRPGRLCRRLEVGLLGANTAKGVFTALCPNVEVPASLNAGKQSLAMVYSLARKAGWEPESRKKEDKNNKENDPRPVSYDEDDDNE
jgi:hypothetical protein